jgi:FkbM family methyltransferase
MTETLSGTSSNYVIPVKRGGGVSYIYAFEPDSQNLEKLRAYVSSSGLGGITEIIPCAAYDQVTELKFSAHGNSTSNISDSGTITIPTETIDRITRNRKVTFIKMDIEGAERNALAGAEQTIRKYHPTLTICAYHKHDDCLVLPALIRSFWEGYKFYFRLHKPYVYEAVLYAVP